MLKKLYRGAFTLLGVAAGYGVFTLGEFLIRNYVELPEGLGLSEMQRLGVVVCIAIIFGFIFYRIAPAVTRQSKKVGKNLEKDLSAIPVEEVITTTAGLVIGLLVAFLISNVYAGFNKYIATGLTIVTYIICAWLGGMIASKKSRDIAAAVQNARKGVAVKPKKQNDAMPKILDTSVIIDGRIADIMRTGFIEGPIVIPEFVLVELRHIADSSDSLKRNRGRRGLDVLNRIQSEHGIEIYNTNGDKSLEEIPEVDVKLLKLAQIMNGKVVTNDFNLNKVAGIKGVKVLNINELANTLKPIVLPGEDMSLYLVKEGKENNQAIAYLDDGTMIVVEEGKRHIGHTLNVTVTSVLQTSAGRMIFAKPKGK